MKTLTTTEHQALVVAASAGRLACTPPAVALDLSGYRMRTANAGSHATDEFGIRPTVFGDWKRPRRLVRLVT